MGWGRMEVEEERRSGRGVVRNNKIFVNCCVASVGPPALAGSHLRQGSEGNFIARPGFVATVASAWGGLQPRCSPFYPSLTSLFYQLGLLGQHLFLLPSLCWEGSGILLPYQTCAELVVIVSLLPTISFLAQQVGSATTHWHTTP